jgi:dihydrofolate reductase
MRELTADLFISLDGFASGLNEAPFFGYFGAELSKWIHNHLEEPQLVVMGRVTFQALAQLSASATDQTSLRMTNLPKLVFSSTLAEPLPWKNSRLVKTEAEKEIKALKQQSGEPLRSIGSISLVKSLMNAGLVDRLRLMVFPLILGHTGREPIYAGYERMGLQLIDTKVLDSRLIVLEYRRA